MSFVSRDEPRNSAGIEIWGGVNRIEHFPNAILAKITKPRAIYRKSTLK